MRGAAGQLLVALLLTVAAAACLAELSGRWDQTIADANDEAGLVAVVLCVGAAAVSAASVIASVPRPQRMAAPCPVPSRSTATLIVPRPLAPANGPPIALRV